MTGSSETEFQYFLQSKYMRLRILKEVFRETYGNLFTIVICSMLAAIIISGYLMVNSTDRPLILEFMIACGILCSTLLLYYILLLATRLNIQSKEFLKLNIGRRYGLSNFDRKFWSAMTPLKIGAGIVCSFETKEFLLTIWGKIIIIKIIDLLIAF